LDNSKYLLFAEPSIYSEIIKSVAQLPDPPDEVVPLIDGGVADVL